MPNTTSVMVRPVLNSAMLIEDGAHVELAFNKSMYNIGNSTAQFTVIRNNASPIGVVGFEISPLGDNIVLLELDQASLETDVLSISYDAGDLQSADGGTLAAFAGEDVINILPYASGGSVDGRCDRAAGAKRGCLEGERSGRALPTLRHLLLQPES